MAFIGVLQAFDGHFWMEYRMDFVLGSVKAHRMDDCWGVSTRAGDGAKHEWNPAKWFYASMRGAAHKMIEIELGGADDGVSVDLHELDDRIVEVCERLERQLIEATAGLEAKRA